MDKKKTVKADVKLKEFWRQNDRFADLFNAVVFGGEEVLKPEDLLEMDTDVSGILQFKNYEESLVRIRDVVKKTAFGVEFVILGIENQQKIHYAMPLRTLLYDALGYLKEYQEITKSRKKKPGKQTKEEFLSGMHKDDRLHPIVSVVIYYSEKEWDGPLCLKDMLADMPKKLESYVSDYKMNLVQVNESEQYTFQNEDVQTVFEISREIFAGNFDKLAEKYGKRDIKAELVSVIGAITESSYLMEQEEGKEAFNMCSSLEKLRMDGVQEGISQGISQGIQRKENEIILKLLKKNYTVHEIAELLEIPEDEVRRVQEQ